MNHPIAPAEQAVRAALARFHAAAQTGDAPALDALLAPELNYVHSNAKTENKAECIAALVRSNIDFQPRAPFTVLTYHEGSSAMVHGQMDAHNPGGLIVPLHCLMMWVKFGEDWRLVARHAVRLPA